MRPFGDRVPRWPALAGVAVLAGAALIAAFAPLLAALAAGAGRTSPAIVLLGALLSAGGIVLPVARVARLTRPVSARQLGLRAPSTQQLDLGIQVEMAVQGCS